MYFNVKHLAAELDLISSIIHVILIVECSDDDYYGDIVKYVETAKLNNITNLISICAHVTFAHWPILDAWTE